MKLQMNFSKLNSVIFFIISFILMSAFILLNVNKINSDIYSIVSFTDEERNILNNLNDSLSKQIIILSKNDDELDDFIEICKTSSIFDNIFYKIDSLSQYQNDILKYKLAFLDDDTINLIKDNPEAFLERSAVDFFNKFKPLPSSKDFFSLSSHSRIMNGINGVKFDIRKNRFLIYLDNEEYYFANAKLKDNYDDNKLLELSQLAKNDDLFMSGGAIYSALGKKSAFFESVIMGGISIILCSVLLFLTFSNLNIFYIVFVIIYGITAGLFSLFLFFEHVHGIAIVISTSLIGLMLDFCIHWLAANTNSVLRKESITKMKKVFLLGFFITSIGYAVFLLSPFPLLSQISVFAIFALVGAFLCSYFLMPNILDGKEFRSLAIWDKFIDYIGKISCYFRFLNIAVISVLLIVFSLFLYYFSHFQDNIDDYHKPDSNMINITQKLTKSFSGSFDFMVVDFGSKLPDVLLEQGLIGSYSNIDKIILDEDKQKEIIDAFVNLDYKLMPGFDEKLVANEIKKLSDSKVYSRSEILNSSLFYNVKNMYMEDINIVFLYDIKDRIAIRNFVNSNNGVFFSFKDTINNAFFDIKVNAIYLKVMSYFMAFLLLCLFCGVRYSLKVIMSILLANLMTLSILTVAGLHINIFAIFGLILGGAVGVDYMIFALNHDLSVRGKWVGINLAALTSMISFFVLSFSGTEAVKVFGLSVAINILLCALFALVYSNNYHMVADK